MKVPHASKRKAAFVDAVVQQILEYQVALQVVTRLLETYGIEHLLLCGCRFGAWGYMPCREHRGKYPKVCFCGQMEELVHRTATCFSIGQTATANHWRIERMKHWKECVGVEWVIPKRKCKAKLDYQELERRLRDAG